MSHTVHQGLDASSIDLQYLMLRMRSMPLTVVGTSGTHATHWSRLTLAAMNLMEIIRMALRTMVLIAKFL